MLPGRRVERRKVRHLFAELCGQPFDQKVLLRWLRQASAVRVGAPTARRRFRHGVHYLLRTGLPWRDLPRRFGHWNRRWCLAGVWERLVAAGAEARRHACRVHRDTPHVRAHPVSAGARLAQGGLLACCLPGAGP